MKTTFIHLSVVLIPMAMLFACQDKNNDDPPAYPDVDRLAKMPANIYMASKK